MDEKHWSGRQLPFDREVRFIVAAAGEVAIKWGHPAMAPAHLLFALAYHAPDVVPGLSREGIEDVIRRKVEASGVQQGRARRPIAPTQQARKILVAAREHASSDEMESVTTNYLLSAIREHGDEVCASLLKETAAEPKSKPQIPARAELDWVTLSDEAPIPYSQQLADQIKDTIASGRLLPGQRLPTIRRLAQALDLAPGTVAKAYRRLGEAEIVQTAGSKGTVIAPPKTDSGASEERIEALVGLLRPIAVAAFHMGADSDELSAAFKRASKGVLETP